MHAKKATVDSLQKKLNKFVASTLTTEAFDFVIPIMRKGLFLLDNALSGKDRTFQVLLLEPDENKLSSDVDLKGKKILIIDDSSRSGGTIHRAKEGIIKNNTAEEINIRTAVFMKSKSCAEKIDYFAAEFDDDNGSDLYGALSTYFDSLSPRLDPDHLVIRGRLDIGVNYPDQRAILSILERELNKFGEYYEQTDSSCSLWHRAKFSVVDLKSKDFDLKNFSSFWKEEGVFKARFCLEPDWILYVLPIFCPEIIPPLLSSEKNCSSSLNSKFCKWSGSSSDSLCRDCISYNLTKIFAERFIVDLNKNLKPYGISFNILDVNWPEIQLRYRNFQERIIADLKDLSKFK